MGGALPLAGGGAGGGMPMGGGMPRVHSTPTLHGYMGPGAALGMQPLGEPGVFPGALPLPVQPCGLMGMPAVPGAVKLEGTYWSAELPQGGGGGGGGMNRSRSCGNLAMGGGGGLGGGLVGMELGGLQQHQTVATAAMLQQQQHQQQQHQQQQQQQQHHPQHHPQLSGGGLHPASSEGSPLLPGQAFGGSGGGAGPPNSSDGGGRPLLVRVGSEQHLIPPQPTQAGLKGMTRIASESHLGSMVPITPTSLLAGASRSAGGLGGGGELSGGGAGGSGGAALAQHQVQQQAMMLQQQHMHQQQALYQHHQQQQALLLQQQQHQLAQRQGIMMQRSHSVAVMGGLESIDELQATASFPALLGGEAGVTMPLLPPSGAAGGMVPLAPNGAHALLDPGGLHGGAAIPLGGLHGGYSHPGTLSLDSATGSGGGAVPGSSAAAAQQLATCDLGMAPASKRGSGGGAAAGPPGGTASDWGVEHDQLPDQERPDSPFGISGAVQIGGEELDMTLAFLSDGPDGMGDAGMAPPSPHAPGDLGAASLLLGDGAVRMDETAG
jgi:hypothetical protein